MCVFVADPAVTRSATSGLTEPRCSTFLAGRTFNGRIPLNVHRRWFVTSIQGPTTRPGRPRKPTSVITHR